MYDAIVIGLGPSGVSCAIYLKRFNYNVLLIGKKDSSLINAKFIDNYYGISHIPGFKLLDDGLKQASDLGVNIIVDEVVSISKQNDTFQVLLAGEESDSSLYEAKSIYLATGKKHPSLNVKNLDSYIGKGVSYCAICDGFFYRKKKIGLIGSSHLMNSEYQVLKMYTSDIHIFKEDEVYEAFGHDEFEGIVTKDGKVLLDGLFVASGMLDSVGFAKHLGLLLDEEDYIKVDDFQTNIKGIFAGGDCIRGVKQVVKAASDGACAAIFMQKYLENKI